jgi:hypothetical protein
MNADLKYKAENANMVEIIHSKTELTEKRQLVTAKTQRAQRNSNAYKNKDSNQTGKDFGKTTD